MYTVLSFTARVVLVYFFTYLATRIMTKKAIAEMTAYEMAGLMVFANVASEPLVDKVVIKSVYGSGLLVLLMLVLARLAIINKITPVLEHTATIIIQNGQIDMKQLKRLSLSMNQLIGLLRQQGYERLSDVQTAILEPQGNLSVFPKAEKKQVTLQDLNISVTKSPISLPLILDGSIVRENLKYIGMTELWLLEELKKQGIQNYKKQVAFAELDSSRNVIVLRK